MSEILRRNISETELSIFTNYLDMKKRLMMIYDKYNIKYIIMLNEMFFNDEKAIINEWRRSNSFSHYVFSADHQTHIRQGISKTINILYTFKDNEFIFEKLQDCLKAKQELIELFNQNAKDLILVNNKLLTLNDELLKELK